MAFENDVEMYGAQTKIFFILHTNWFENDVEMYGAQTLVASNSLHPVFENDVEMYGAQTGNKYHFDIPSLRMM